MGRFRAIKKISSFLSWMRHGWKPRFAIFVLLVGLAPPGLVAYHSFQQPAVPDSLRFVPRDANWFVVGQHFEDLTLDFQRHLRLLQYWLLPPYRWDSRKGLDNYNNLFSLIPRLLGGFSANSNECFLPQDAKSLRAAGFDPSGSFAFIRTGKLSHFVIPTSDAELALFHLIDQLSGPAARLSLDSAIPEDAKAGVFGYSITVKSEGLVACESEMKLQQDSGRTRLYSINNTIPDRSSPAPLATSINVPFWRPRNEWNSAVTLNVECLITGTPTASSCQCSLGNTSTTLYPLGDCRQRTMFLPQEEWPHAELAREILTGKTVVVNDAFLVKKVENYLLVSHRNDEEKPQISETIPDVAKGTSMRDDITLVDLMRGLVRESPGGLALMLGAVRPSALALLEQQSGTPSIPLYLPAFFGLSADQKGLRLFTRLNMSPQDTRLLQLFATRDDEFGRGHASVSTDKGVGTTGGFRDKALLSYPSVIDSAVPGVIPSLAEAGRLYPTFFDLLAEQVTSVSVAILSPRKNSTPAAVITAFPKGKLSELARVVGELAKRDYKRRVNGAFSQLGEYYQSICKLGGKAGSLDECIRSLFAGDLENAPVEDGADKAILGSILENIMCRPPNLNIGYDLFLEGQKTKNFSTMINWPRLSSKLSIAGASGPVDYPSDQNMKVWFEKTGSLWASRFQKQIETESGNFESFFETLGPAEASAEEFAAELTAFLEKIIAARAQWGANHAIGQNSKISEAIEILRHVAGSRNLSPVAMKEIVRKVLIPEKQEKEKAEAGQTGISLLDMNSVKLLYVLPTPQTVFNYCLEFNAEAAEATHLYRHVKDLKDGNVALVLYERPYAEQVSALVDALFSRSNAAKLDFEFNTDTFIKSDESYQENLTSADVGPPPYSLIMLQLDGLQSDDGIELTIGLTERAQQSKTTIEGAKP